MYFQTCTTIDEAKAIYKTLYIANNTSAETMAEINDQFTAFKEAIVAPAKVGEVVSSTTDEKVKELAVVAAKIEGCAVDICGNWIWVRCDKENTAAHEILKANRFRFSGNKKAWYFTNQPFKKRRGTSTLPKIKMKYGAEAVQTEML